MSPVADPIITEVVGIGLWLDPPLVRRLDDIRDAFPGGMGARSSLCLEGRAHRARGVLRAAPPHQRTGSAPRGRRKLEPPLLGPRPSRLRRRLGRLEDAPLHVLLRPLP